MYIRKYSCLTPFRIFIQIHGLSVSGGVTSVLNSPQRYVRLLLCFPEVPFHLVTWQDSQSNTVLNTCRFYRNSLADVPLLADSSRSFQRSFRNNPTNVRFHLKNCWIITTKVLENPQLPVVLIFYSVRRVPWFMVVADFINKSQLQVTHATDNSQSTRIRSVLKFS